MKIGDYVRTKDGIIGKIIDRNMAEVDDRYELDYNNKLYYYKDIAKSSSNIIDLIEVGDYVNGHRVIEIDNKDKDIFNKYLVVEEVDYDNYNISYSNNYIKSIITKEQFEHIKYEVNNE